MSLLSRINLVNKTQTSTTIMITEIRLSFTIMNFNDDFLLKHINIMSKIKKTIYLWMSKSNIMFTKTFFTRMPFIKIWNFIIIIELIIIIMSTKKLKMRIPWNLIFLRNPYNLIAVNFIILILYSTINYTSTFASFITNLNSR